MPLQNRQPLHLPRRQRIPLMDRIARAQAWQTVLMRLGQMAIQRAAVQTVRLLLIPQILRQQRGRAAAIRERQEQEAATRVRQEQGAVTRVRQTRAPVTREPLARATAIRVLPTRVEAIREAVTEPVIRYLLYSQPRRRGQKQEKNGNGNGMGKKFGVTISLALVFGLVAGLVFQGVNVIGSRYLDSGSSSQPQLQSTELVQQTEEASSSGSSSATTVSSNSVAAVAQSVMPSVVAITSVSVQEVQSFFGGVQQYQGVSSGSGVIVGENDEELLIATNNHVVEDAEELSVCFIGDDVVTSEEIQENLQNNGGLNMDGAVSASIKGTDADNDLAVISVKKSDIPEETMSEIKIASVGNSDDLQVGEQVVAIGNALDMASL